jgi:hypothetical protein
MLIYLLHYPTRQRQEALTDQELAIKLGIDNSIYSRIKRGLYKPSLTFYRGVVNAFPDLKPLVDAEIYGKPHYMHTEAPVRKTLLAKFLEVFK